MLYSGIDLHKRTIAIHTLDAAGTLVRKADLPTQREVITAYFRGSQVPIRRSSSAPACGIGSGTCSCHRELTCGSATRSISRRSAYAHVKTDAVDAATLAQLLRLQLIPRRT